MSEDIMQLLYKVCDGRLEGVALESLNPLAEDGLVHIIDSEGYKRFVGLKEEYERLRTEINSSIKRLDKLYRKHHNELPKWLVGWWSGKEGLKREGQEIEQLKEGIYGLLDRCTDVLIKTIQRDYGYGVTTIEYPKTEFETLRHQKVLEFTISYGTGEGLFGAFLREVALSYHGLQSGDYVRITKKGAEKLGESLKDKYRLNNSDTLTDWRTWRDSFGDGFF